MAAVDAGIFIVYMLVMLGVGVFFLRQNKSDDDYFVGGRSIGKVHIGLSVVATDVGGGFSIGLGGLGFAIGLSGSHMLLTGLIGAWLSAVFLIPRVSQMARTDALFTFPQIVGRLFNSRAGLIAGVISAIGYVGFTSSQILAGAKLASATFPVLSLSNALWIMGIIAVVYTVLGGLKAVIYTDTVQWIILMGGLIFIGIPLGYQSIGGYESIVKYVSPEHLTFTNISWQEGVNWAVTIIPVWFVGMTLYQRIFAAKNEKEAKQAWYIAGLLEWPVMAFMGVLLGLFAKVGYEQGMFADIGFAPGTEMDAEMGLPLLLRTVLPVGLMGLMMSAYFSAIMSTADSCLMAAGGNVVTDILGKFINFSSKKSLRMSQLTVLVIGIAAVLIAQHLTNVLELMLLSYAFMVSGLFVPVVGGLFWRRSSNTGAILAMLVGGSVTSGLVLADISLPYQLDANVFGISAAALVFAVGSILIPDKTDKA